MLSEILRISTIINLKSGRRFHRKKHFILLCDFFLTDIVFMNDIVRINVIDLRFDVALYNK